MTPGLTVDRLPPVLLEHLLDHAALFPPAELSMAEALAVDRAARSSPCAALVGVFVCPSSRLAELTAAQAAHREATGDDTQLPLSVVVDGSRVPRPTDAHVDLRMVELRMDAADALRALEPTPPGIPAYVEVPIERLGRQLDALAAARAGGRPIGGKVRCGGSRAPSDAELAAVIIGCAERGLPLKATQGLHAAVRTEEEHGFLNVLLACAAALEAGDVGGTLAERSGEVLLSAAPPFDLAQRVRRELLVSYGTCSLSEPVAELQRLGVLL